MSSTRFVRLRILWITIGLFTGVLAHAFVPYFDPAGNVLRWNLINPNAPPNVVNPATKAIRYYIASDLYSVSNRTAELNAVRACYAQWQSIPGTILKFEEAGFVAPGVDISPDGTNVVFWAKKSHLVNGGLDSMTGRQGYTVVRFASDNTIIEADTALNGIDYDWFTDFNDKSQVIPFIEGVLLHEIGHAIGLDHTPIGGGTVTTGAPGVGTESGLSSDEIAAARFLYPDQTIRQNFGYIRGRVTMNGAPVFGAIVVGEDAAGNILSGTISRETGEYDLGALPPGPCVVRATPLDPAGNSDTLFRGADVHPAYSTAETAFLPTPNRPTAITAGVTNIQDFALTPGEPPMRITKVSNANPTFGFFSTDRFAAAAHPGQRNIYVGVSGPTLPVSDATLTVTGDGLTIGPTIFLPNQYPGTHLLAALVTISSDATPGLRTFVVQQGSNYAYANGYLDLQPLIPDFNFDGLDDNFQRTYFPLFTAPEAAPGADPDSDGFNNLHEYLTGTNPVDPKSFSFKVLSVKVLIRGALIVFESGPGHQYQLYRRDDFSGATWQPAGNPVTATETTTSIGDLTAPTHPHYYRIGALP